MWRQPDAADLGAGGGARRADGAAAPQEGEILLERPATELEATTRMGLTAISAAAFKGHNRIVAMLLERGADPNAANIENQTAIMFASLAGRDTAVQMLLDAGADPESQASAGDSALSIARAQGADHVVEILEGRPGKYPSDAPVPLELQDAALGP